MRKEFDDTLRRTYPDLYRNRQGTALQTGMQWGFSHGDGWYPIVDVLSALLSAHDPGIVADQIKQKFGMLCVYYTGHSDYADGVVGMAKVISGATCEICGAPTEPLKVPGWIETRCAKHRPGYSGRPTSLEVFTWSGIGPGWACLVTLLQSACDVHARHNSMRPVILRAAKANGRLLVTLAGGDQQTAGMIDFINHYAFRIDEHAGEAGHNRVAL